MNLFPILLINVFFDACLDFGVLFFINEVLPVPPSDRVAGASGHGSVDPWGPEVVGAAICVQIIDSFKFNYIMSLFVQFKTNAIGSFL